MPLEELCDNCIPDELILLNSENLPFWIIGDEMILETYRLFFYVFVAIPLTGIFQKDEGREETRLC